MDLKEIAVNAKAKLVKSRVSSIEIVATNCKREVAAIQPEIKTEEKEKLYTYIDSVSSALASGVSIVPDFDKAEKPKK